MFIYEHEVGFLRYLKKQKINANEYEFPDSKLANIQDQFNKLIEKNYYLNCSAKDGYRSSLQAYASHSEREIFDVNQLDLGGIAKSFGLTAPPRVDLAVKVSGQTSRKHKLKDQFGQKRADKTNRYNQKRDSHQRS